LRRLVKGMKGVVDTELDFSEVYLSESGIVAV